MQYHLFITYLYFPVYRGLVHQILTLIQLKILHWLPMMVMVHHFP